MRIDSSSLQVESSHTRWSQTQENLSGQRSGRVAPNAAGRGNGSAVSQLLPDIRSALADISAAARQRLEADLSQASATGAVAKDDEPELEPMLALLKSMIEALTGEAINIPSRRDWPQSRPVPALATPQTSGNQAGPVYRRTESYESVQMSASGSIRTDDGREISFSLDLSYERYIREETFVQSTPAPARKDPLILNFSGGANMLIDQLFSFDLNSDGKSEQLPGLASGVAFLAFDRNGNGRIDDGSELFGPETDNGFGELARLDDDANGWIDEADSAFKDLVLWRPETDGTPLSTLSKSGIGALALARAQTQFDLGEGAQALGALRESGIFLTESGTAGLLQEIDLNQR